MICDVEWLNHSRPIPVPGLFCIDAAAPAHHHIQYLRVVLLVPGYITWAAFVTVALEPSPIAPHPQLHKELAAVGDDDRRIRDTCLSKDGLKGGGVGVVGGGGAETMANSSLKPHFTYRHVMQRATTKSKGRWCVIVCLIELPLPSSLSGTPPRG